MTIVRNNCLCDDNSLILIENGKRIDSWNSSDIIINHMGKHINNCFVWIQKWMTYEIIMIELCMCYWWYICRNCINMSIDLSIIYWRINIEGIERTYSRSGILYLFTISSKLCCSERFKALSPIIQKESVSLNVKIIVTKKQKKSQ